MNSTLLLNTGGAGLPGDMKAFKLSWFSNVDTSELNQSSGLAQAVGGLTSVVGKVLLPHLGDSQVVPLVILADGVPPPHVQLHVVLVPDNVSSWLSMDNADHYHLVTSTSLNYRMDSMDMWGIENMELDLVLGRLAHTVSSFTEVQARSCSCDGVKS